MGEITRHDPPHAVGLPQALRAATPARVALGRAGGSLTTAEVLRFQVDHAAARDAVHAELDLEALTASLRALGVEVVAANSAASGTSEFLQRPDLGRRLDPSSRDRLAEVGSQREPVDIAIVVSTGLSAFAVQSHAVAVLAELTPRLEKRGYAVAPIVVVRHGRVALQDAIGELLRARLALTLLGERPGLGTPDSLGAYLVHDPRPGRTDAERNCVSNIHAGGLSAPSAAEALDYLIAESLRRGISGVELKDDRVAALPGQ